jgi:hypothetical protein
VIGFVAVVAPERQLREALSLRAFRWLEHSVLPESRFLDVRAWGPRSGAGEEVAEPMGEHCGWHGGVVFVGVDGDIQVETGVVP